VDRRVLLQVLEDLLRDRPRDREQGPRLPLLVELDRLEDPLFRLLPEALEAADLPVLRGTLQVVDVRDPEALPQDGRALRPEAAESHHLDDPLRELLPELLEGVHLPLPQVLVDLLRDRLPHTLDLPEARDPALADRKSTRLNSSHGSI